MKKIVIGGIQLILSLIISAQNQVNYKTPPTEIIKLLEAKATPEVLIGPTGEWLLQKSNTSFPSIVELSKPEIRIAGIRFDTVNYCQTRVSYNDSLTLTNLKTNKDYVVSGLPDNSRLTNFQWSPNGKFVAFTNTTNVGVELWILDIDKKKVEKLTDAVVNAVMPMKPVIWVDAGEWMIFTSVIQNSEPKPKRNCELKGPIIKESYTEKADILDYHDLLLNENDEDFFEYYTTSQLIKINIHKQQFPIGIPAVFKEFSTSPDFRFILVKMIHKPFSHIVPYNYFPYKVEIWDNEGNLFRELFELPLVESVPKGFGAVQKGPREIGWRGDKPATLYWLRALDGGDPKREMVTRDRLFLFDFPFDGDGYESIAFKDRFWSIQWGNSDVAITTERSWKTNTETVSSFSPDASGGGNKKMLFEYNWQDEYNIPGTFITKKNAAGCEVLQFSEKETKLYMKGEGASPEGNKPFVDSYDLTKGEKHRLWQSNNPYYEYPLTFIEAEKEIILTRCESRIDPPNYFSRNLRNGVVSQITNNQNPFPQLSKMNMERIQYSRGDGVKLTGTLYTPPGFKIGDAMLPVLMWVYGDDSKNATTDSQAKDSPNCFVKVSWDSPIYWVMRGYAVFDNPGMPIIEEGKNELDTTFIEQLVANAKAAVHCLDSLGIADVKKIAIGGHGYGAFIAANLLANTDLFVAGICRSGSYNLTLTPFGFQTEPRTFWEAKNTYFNNSPFLHADKINAPVLLIHGDADDNPYFLPMQSERMFTALKANGTDVRLVILPYESHEYRAKESINNMIWEMDKWLKKYFTPTKN